MKPAAQLVRILTLTALAAAMLTVHACGQWRRATVADHRDATASITGRKVGQPGAVSSPGQAPHLGTIEFGAFAPEAAALSNINNLSLPSLNNDADYAQYRAAVRAAYGADFADMNYLAVGKPDWEPRFAAFQAWLFRAARYGSPTIALEPLGASGYGAFKNTPEMQRLRTVFDETSRAGIVVWVRFASEANLRLSVYSVYDSPQKIQRYRQAVRWFRAYMPRNVRLVFSPLINTAYLRERRQLETLRGMYVRGDYDRIGGTLYATTWLRLKPAYTWYHAFMRGLDPDSPFQICELGGMYAHRADVEGFLRALSRGAWPDVERVNLFGGDLNPTAVSEHGHFGLIEPGASVSYIAAFFRTPPMQTRGSLLAKVGRRFGSEYLTLRGIVLQADRHRKHLVIRVDQVTDKFGETVMLSPPRRKRILIGQETKCANDDKENVPKLQEGVVVSGWDNGAGTPLRAARISFLAAPK